MEKSLFHQHLLLRAFVHNPPKLEDDLNIWLTQLVADIQMKVVCAAKSKYVDAVGNKGLTGSINIETTHIAIHIWDEQVPARIEMDVYSCSCFDPNTVFAKLNEWGLHSVHYWLVDRNHDQFGLVKTDTILFEGEPCPLLSSSTVTTSISTLQP